jgi:hypothetical protein
MTISHNNHGSTTAAVPAKGFNHLRRSLGLLAIGSVGVMFATGNISPNAIRVGGGPAVRPILVPVTITKVVEGDGVRPTTGWEFTIASANCVSSQTLTIAAAGGVGTVQLYDVNAAGTPCLYTVTETAVSGWTSTVSPSGSFGVVDVVPAITVTNSSPTTTTSTTSTTTTTTEAVTTTTELTTTPTEAFIVPVVNVIPPAPAAPEVPTSAAAVPAAPVASPPASTTTVPAAPATTSAPVVQGSIPSGAIATPGLVDDEELALTGNTTGRSLLIGGGLVALGSLAVMATRKRAAQK